MKLKSLDDLFLHEVKDIYSAEKQLVQALPKMAKTASAPQLKRAFEEHLQQTMQHVQRLEDIFTKLDEKPGRMKCKGMEGLIEEGEELIKEDADPSVKDAALIGAAQRVEHYEIAAYGTARTFAQQLNYNDIADLLQQTLDEESETDEKLTALAENGINLQAQS